MRHYRYYCYAGSLLLLLMAGIAVVLRVAVPMYEWSVFRHYANFDEPASASIVYTCLDSGIDKQYKLVAQLSREDTDKMLLAAPAWGTAGWRRVMIIDLGCFAPPAEFKWRPDDECYMVSYAPRLLIVNKTTCMMYFLYAEM